VAWPWKLSHDRLKGSSLGKGDPARSVKDAWKNPANSRESHGDNADINKRTETSEVPCTFRAEHHKKKTKSHHRPQPSNWRERLRVRDSTGVETQAREEGRTATQKRRVGLSKQEEKVTVREDAKATGRKRFRKDPRTVLRETIRIAAWGEKGRLGKVGESGQAIFRVIKTSLHPVWVETREIRDSSNFRQGRDVKKVTRQNEGNFYFEDRGRSAKTLLHLFEAIVDTAPRGGGTEESR